MADGFPLNMPVLIRSPVTEEWYEGIIRSTCQRRTVPRPMNKPGPPESLYGHECELMERREDTDDPVGSRVFCALGDIKPRETP